MHQTVGNVLRTLLHSEPPQNIEDAKEFVDEALSIAKHAIRAGIHSTLGSSPGSLIFIRDMFLNIPLIASWHAISQKREHLIHENLMQKNQKRRWYDYLPEHVVHQLYSIQYKGFFGAPDKVRQDTCVEARPSRLNFQRDEVKIHHVIASMQDCWS
jgi:hypothetical protein